MPVSLESLINTVALAPPTTSLQFCALLLMLCPVLCLAFFTAVRNLALLSIAVEAVDATRAALRGWFAALCALVGDLLVTVHGCGWRSGVLATVRR